MEWAICRARSLLGAALVLPAPLPELLEGNAPALVGFKRPAPVVAYTPLWLKGTQCPTQWSSGPEMEHKD